MKKKLLMAMMIGLSVMTVGCGSKNGTTNSNTDTNTNTSIEDTVDDEDTIDEITDVDNDVNNEADVNDNTGADETVYDSVGQMMLAKFESIVKTEPGLSAEEVANRLIDDDSLPFGAGVMPVEEGLLTGFNNTEITGFKEGAFFAPMIGSIPFAGYVFTLEDGADTDAFISLLEENADLRWNICTEADEMVSGNVETQVFFLMCPATFEEADMID